MHMANKEELINAANRADKKTDGPLSQHDFIRITGFREWQIENLFTEGGWSELKRLAKIESQPMRSKTLSCKKAITKKKAIAKKEAIAQEETSITREIVERRRFPRRKVCTSAQLEMFDVSFPVSVEELSIEGLKIRSARSVSPETYVSIRISVGRDIVFHSQVVWTMIRLIGKEYTYQMGLHIDSILERGEEIIGFAERKILIQDLIILIKQV
jgi:hypothetical protein